MQGGDGRGSDEPVAFGGRVIDITVRVGVNAFSNSGLEAVFSERRIRDVLVADVLSLLCIDSTGRAADEGGVQRDDPVRPHLGPDAR